LKVVLDTNVLISGIFFTGPPKAVIEAWIDGRIDVAVSLDILDEYRRVLGELSGRFPEVDTTGLMDFVTMNSAICDVESLDEQICDDPDDDKFLACALASDAKVLITGDKAILRVGHLQELRILRPRSFLDEFLSE
jgi:putative PIN family toxin of toxin-antitoxin system